MRSWRRGAPGVAAVGGALLGVALLAACTSGPDPVAAASPTVGPLDVYLDLITGVEDESAEAFVAQASKAEEIVAACMHDAGFEYVPDPTRYHSSVQDTEALATFDEHAYAAEYGYGLTEPGERPGITTSSVADDPNTEYQMAMSPAQGAAYQKALQGVFAFGDTAPTDEEIDAAYTAPWTEKGCSGRAEHEAFDWEVATSEDVVMIRDEWEGSWQRDLDPQFDAVRTAWVACMREAGTPAYTHPQDAVDQLQAEMLVRQEALAGGEPGSGKAWKELHELEITVAVADLACQDATDYQDELEALEHERQQEFVDTHRAELDALVERYSADR
ncbi:hypothetical protein ACGIF2_17015 [Cellulomonas sp. P22]|uniref:hypothetical protein n=1 Tax=Cellulomonas sp. P22 TaxID=3373189 RepID=UPI0037898FA1